MSGMSVHSTTDWKVPPSPPPAYREAGNEFKLPLANETPLPPTYIAPSSYQIGLNILPKPLVSTEELKAHLALLRAFKLLRETVKERTAFELGLPPAAHALEKDQRWAWFVGLAVERFYRWLHVVPFRVTVDEWILEEMPPIDVLMVWHAYLLNPAWYAEDCIRSPVLNTLRILSDRLLEAIVRIGDINRYEVPESRKDLWRRILDLPWDPFDSITHLLEKSVECPKCEVYSNAPLLTRDGLGYLQQSFCLRCSNCGFTINKDTLAIAKLVKAYGAPESYLAGTLYTPTQLEDREMAGRIKDAIQKHTSFDDIVLTPGLPRLQALKVKVLQVANNSMDKVREDMKYALKRGGVRRARRIASAYFDDNPFSVDLVGAVIRQCSFIDKMHDFGWTDPGCFESEEDQLVLVHSIARYHAFLDLMTTAPTTFFVPTLDIDLAWHTHQMMGSQYSIQCKQYVGRYIDHDDKVDENLLATSFDITCRAWQYRFHIPYMHCGCSLPGDTIGQRLSRFSRRFSGMTQQQDPTGLEPPSRPDALSATHPSDHSCVETKLNASTRHKRVEKVKKRRERDAKLIREGKIDEKRFHRGDGHDAAFLYPIPFYIPSAGTCVSPVGNFIGRENGSLSSCAAGAPGGCGGAACGAFGCGGAGCGGGCGGGGCGGGGSGSGGCGGG
ncbi:hypothetical protein C8Q75DRAFT_805043 [Abortiporus biennis]|nr:hypothetical protein C8Q75DRAFT_805043 [Abortiporus biennis]